MAFNYAASAVRIEQRIQTEGWDKSLSANVGDLAFTVATSTVGGALDAGLNPAAEEIAAGAPEFGDLAKLSLLIVGSLQDYGAIWGEIVSDPNAP